MIRAVVATLVILPLAAAAQPAKAPDIVCDLTTLVAGRMEGRTFRGEGPSSEAGLGLRLTFRDHDRTAGTAKMILGDETDERLVVMTVDRDAIVYLYEESGIGKLLVSTQAKATPDGWPAIVSKHGWIPGELTVQLLTGVCRTRAR